MRRTSLAILVAMALPHAISSEIETRKHYLREDDYYKQADAVKQGRRSGEKQRMREHEDRLLKESGKKLWSRRRDDGGPEFPIVPSFGPLPHQSSLYSMDNPRSRNLHGTDSFHMIGTTISDPDYGIGSGDNNRQTPPEHPRNKNSKSSKSSHSGQGPAPSRPPTPNRQPTRPPSSIQPPTFLPPSGGGSCKDPIRLQFLQFSAIPPAILVFPEDPNVQDLGTRYVYNSDLRDANTLDELIGSRSNGLCTRTQARIQEISGAVYQLGGGHCQFTYTLKDEGNRELTLEASGTVVDSMGGTLSITGGTKDAIGAYGEMTLVSGLWF